MDKKKRAAASSRHVDIRIDELKQEGYTEEEAAALLRAELRLP